MFERRRHRRVKPQGLSTPFGEVTDVSESGLGVYCKTKPSNVGVGQTRMITVAFDGQTQNLSATVQRIDALGPRAVELGFTLNDVSGELKAWLRSMGTMDDCVTTGPRVYLAA
ncbi:MAG: PilZ domain-containing protein [Planctomycetota bacterium]